MSESDNLPLDVAIAFRDQFREARALVGSDSEAFIEIMFVVERLGTVLTRHIGDLGKYKVHIAKLAHKSGLIGDSGSFGIGSDTRASFEELYQILQDARNDALHHGAFARNISMRAIELAIILEDALLMDAIQTSQRGYLVSHFMVRNPTVAYEWQPISLIRQQMLANSYSYIPIRIGGKWSMISDGALAAFLSVDRKDRTARLAMVISKAMKSGLKIDGARTCLASASVADVIKSFEGKPILVLSHEDETILDGILTAFDLL